MTSHNARAFARRTDPATSHDAAASIDADTLTENRRAVLDVIRAQSEPLTDIDLIVVYQAEAMLNRVPWQTDSGVRTRRSELVRAGLVEPAGKREYPKGRGHSLWQAAA